MTVRPRVAIVHDYLTQFGGAERVVLSMLRAFPDAPIYTSLYSPKRTYPEFASADVRTLPLQRVWPLGRHHRWGFPLYAPMFSRLLVDAEITICSSSGWAHGARASGRKIIYCHTPARWLYESDSYLRQSSFAARIALGSVAPVLRTWDRRSAASADVVLVNSTAVLARVRKAWGLWGTVLHPPFGVNPNAVLQEVGSLEPGFLLVVARLLPYKNIGAIIAAAGSLDIPLVVVGSGPDARRLAAIARGRVTFLHQVSDSQLAWLYANSSGLICASYEDFGLTPLEANAFGCPVAALRWGGFMDTVRDGLNGTFFAKPEPNAIACAVRALLGRAWDRQAIRTHAEDFTEARFIRALRDLVAGASPNRQGKR